jgi:putative ABC transport system permease protein
MEEYLKTPGIRAASRVATGQLRQQVVAPGSPVRIVGIDRTTFHQVAWYREDFSRGTSLGELMNRLGANPTGVLVERRFAEAAQLDLGRPLVLSTEQGNEPHQFLVVGLVDYFPSLYPGDMPFVVGNIDYVEDELGFLPHDVWLAVEPTMPLARLQGDLQARGLVAPQAQDARLLIQRAKQDPLRVGTFGLLSVGFIAGTLLTVLGFIVHTLLVFRERILELGLLRAMGLTVGDLGLMLMVEHLFAVVAGLAVGSLAGLTASQLFGPYLLVAEVGRHAGIPPVIPASPRGDLVGLWLLLAGLLLLTIPTLIAALARRRLAEGLRLGETTG